MKLDLSKYQETDRLSVALFGPAGSSKTTTAFSLCAKFPKNLLANRKKIVLDDVIYWQWDPDGAISIAPFGMRVAAKHLINMPALIAEFGFPKALRMACEAAADLARTNPKITVEIHDTVTTFDKFSLTYIERTTKDAENTQKIFGQHLANHRFYSTETMVRPARVMSVYLFHERVLDEARIAKATKAEKIKARQKQMADGTISIIPATTGSGGEFYLNAVSLELSVVATPVAGKRGLYKYEMYPITHQGRRAKSRFRSVLTDKMPCDLKILRRKIQLACK